jgi:glycosyltransferase involved in cell wall biosynthesis
MATARDDQAFTVQPDGDPSAVLYISYDGMLEPLGQSQVLAYLERLADERVVHLLSFEKLQDLTQGERVAAIAARMQRAGIRWHPLRYHKRPSALATAYDIAAGILCGTWIARRHGAGLVHARSYVAGVMALAIQRLAGIRFLFDMRGFWADERVDGGLWPRDGRMYRTAKWFEQRLLQSADHVVSLTHAGVAEMRRFPYLQSQPPRFSVIPTCADLARFCPQPARAPGLPFVLGYVGSAGTWYRFDAVARAFQRLARLQPGVRLLVVNRGEHAYIRQALEDAGVDLGRVEIVQAEHAAVPALIGRMDAGIFFIRQAYSKQASAPTKLAEFLGCGRPCLSNSGVGDMAAILRQRSTGVAIDDFDDASLDQGLQALLVLCADPDTASRCIATAREHFSLDEGVRRYRAIWQELVP